MNKPNIKQHLRRGFFALAIVGALLTLPNAQAQPIPVTGSSTDCEHIISVRTVGQNENPQNRCRFLFHFFQRKFGRAAYKNKAATLVKA